jgi:hypothetical protein
MLHPSSDSVSSVANFCSFLLRSKSMWCTCGTTAAENKRMPSRFSVFNAIISLPARGRTEQFMQRMMSCNAEATAQRFRFSVISQGGATIERSYSWNANMPIQLDRHFVITAPVWLRLKRFMTWHFWRILWDGDLQTWDVAVQLFALTPRVWLFRPLTSSHVSTMVKTNRIVYLVEIKTNITRAQKKMKRGKWNEVINETYEVIWIKYKKKPNNTKCDWKEASSDKLWAIKTTKM